MDNINEMQKAVETIRDGLSGSGKMVKDQIKLDEGGITKSFINIESTVGLIKKQMGILVTEYEVNFYLMHHEPSKIQIRLVQAYYAKYFDSYKDFNLLTRKQYMELLILLKKKLLIDLGYRQDEIGGLQSATLPYILSGNASYKINTKYMDKCKFVTKIKENLLYQSLIKTKYRVIEDVKPGMILSLLNSTISSIMNTRFTYVDFQNPDLLGKEITDSQDKIFEELLFFLSAILIESRDFLYIL